jgi:hypothetical protein
MKESQNSYAYRFGGFSVTSVNLLRLISELEGSYQLLKYMGFEEDMNTVDEIKKRYYKLYFKKSKEEKNEAKNP